MMCLHHWEPTRLPPTLPPASPWKTIFPKTTPGARNAGDLCCRASTFTPQGPAHLLLVTTCFYKIDPYYNFKTIDFHFTEELKIMGI